MNRLDNTTAHSTCNSVNLRCAHKFSVPSEIKKD